MNATGLLFALAGAAALWVAHTNYRKRSKQAQLVRKPAPRTWVGAFYDYDRGRERFMGRTCDGSACVQRDGDTAWLAARNSAGALLDFERREIV